jgi:Fe-S-cluster-containing dehydrogenase component
MICSYCPDDCPYQHANCNHSSPHKKNEKCTSLSLGGKQVCPACIEVEVDFLTKEEMVL